MRFALKTNPQNTTWAALESMWKEADAVEAIDSAWVFDHFYPIFSNPTGPCFEGWTVLSALAQVTSRLRIGTMVNGMPYRHPAITANMAATLDHISGGRLELGLGAGWNQEEAGAYGISLGATLGGRMDMFDEGVEAIVGLLTNERTTLDGVHVQLTDARCEPKGVQKPRPPIVIGGGGEKRTLRTVARWADHWNSVPASPDTWLHKRGVLADHCADIGRDPAEIMTSMLFRLDPADTDALRGRILPYGELGLDLAVINVPQPFDVEHVRFIGRLAETLA